MSATVSASANTAWVLPSDAYWMGETTAVHAVCGREVIRRSLGEILTLGPREWDDLVRRSGCASPFMSWAWHRAWFDSAEPAEAQSSEVLTLRGMDGALQALLPVRVARVRFRRANVRALIWSIGDAGCPDELDIPALPDADMPSLAAAIDSMPWQVLILSNLADKAPQAARLRAALAARGHTVRHSQLWRCPQFALPSSWEAYLASLSPNRRQMLRRKERNLRKAHAITLRDYDGDRLDVGWSHLIALHQRRWEGAGGGAFQDARITRLQRQFADEMAQQQRLWLTTLDADGQPAAAWYGFTSDSTVYFYQGGRDPRFEHESVGLVLMGLMIRRAIERGFRTFNFLRGDDAYKRQWTSSARTTGETVVLRAGWSGLPLRALDAMARSRSDGA